MAPDNSNPQNIVYTSKLKAGKRRSYFFDVKKTRGNDYFITITENSKRHESDNMERTKIFLYKEDFNKFIDCLSEAIDHVKTELMPDYNFDFDPRETKSRIRDIREKLDNDKNLSTDDIDW